MSPQTRTRRTQRGLASKSAAVESAGGWESLRIEHLGVRLKLDQTSLSAITSRTSLVLGHRAKYEFSKAAVSLQQPPFCQCPIPLLSQLRHAHGAFWENAHALSSASDSAVLGEHEVAQGIKGVHVVHEVPKEPSPKAQCRRCR